MTLLVLASLLGCRQPMPEKERDWRDGRQRAVMAALPTAARSSLHALRFFPFDRAYRVRTMIAPVVPPQPLTLAASDGSTRPAHRVGTVKVALPEGGATLSLYRLDDMAASAPDHLFLPFKDAAAGRETYGSGRYLEVQALPGGVVELDFNRAYNPDCAYGISGQCPITPAENTLAFVVAAGEMNPEGAATH